MRARILAETICQNFQYFSETVSSVSVFDRMLLSPILCRQAKISASYERARLF
jgi:hypothetical protein